MIYIERAQTDPFFNIAAEEYLIKNTREEVMMLWQNQPSVIIGKHQNTLKEVNLNFVKESNIPVIRRISGGGAVFHDLGNINYTLITQANKQENLVDFRKFSQPVIEFLTGLGLEPHFEGKNNLVLQGKKFSGNSAHVFKNRVMHHGTLLFDTRLDILENIINPQQYNINDKAIRSIQATVTNISHHLKEKADIESFKGQMAEFLKRYFKIVSQRGLTEEDVKNIEKLAQEKYHSWQWNFGYSPKYQFKNEVWTDYGNIRVYLEAEGGIVSKIQLIFEGERLTEVENQIRGHAHDKTIILRQLDENQFSETVVAALFPASGTNKDSGIQKVL